MKYNFIKQRELQRPLNMSEGFIERCHFLFIRANESAVIGDFGLWVSVLHALKRSIVFKLTEEELNKINKEIPSITNLNSLSIGEELDKAEILIIELMYKYGLYYPIYKQKKEWKSEAMEDEDV